MMRKVLALLGTRSLQFALGLMGGIIVARMLGPANRGAVAVIGVLETLLIAAANLGLGTSTTHLVGRGKARVDQVAGNLLAGALILGAAAIAAGLAVYLALRRGVFVDIPLAWILIALAGIPAALLLKYATYLLLGLGRKEVVYRLRIVQGVLSLTGIVTLVWWFRTGVAGVLAAGLISIAAAAAWALASVRRQTPVRLAVDRAVLGQMMVGGWAPYLALLVMNLNFRIDVALLQWLRGAEEVGIYSLGVSVAEKVSYLPEALALVVLSRVATSADAEANRGTSQVLRNTLWFLGLFGILLGTAAGWVIPLVYGEAFADSTLSLRLLLPGMLGLTVYQLIHSDLTGRGRAQVTLWVFLVALALNVALNLWWIPRWGAAGAALASTVSYSSGALGLLVCYRRITGVGWRELFVPARSEIGALAAGMRRTLLAGEARKL